MWYKVNKRFVGTEKVRPNKYEYSYDFRNKTLAWMQSDGWAFDSTSWVTINSSWIAFNAYNAAYIVKPSGLTNALSNAKKVTMELYFYNAGNTRTTESDTQLTIATNWTRNITWYFGNCKIIACRVYGTNIKYDTYTISAWEYTSTVTIDFVNKTLRLVYSSLVDQSFSLTDTQISNIKAQNSLRIDWSEWAITKTMKVTIE